MTGRHRPLGDEPAGAGHRHLTRRSVVLLVAVVVGLAIAGAALTGVISGSRSSAASPAEIPSMTSPILSPAVSPLSSPAVPPAVAPLSVAARPVVAPSQLTGSPAAAAPAPPALSKTPIPARLMIASIGVDTPLQPLGLAANGAMESPSQWEVAGWYDKGVRPGDPGPAVIAGHVDSRYGPAVFYHLRDLKPGDKAVIAETGGRNLVFVVDSVVSYPKNTFPTEAVYGPTPDPVLRLITCTGDFDWTARSYLDNLVVSGHVVG